jgi:hypothetical protein
MSKTQRLMVLMLAVAVSCMHLVDGRIQAINPAGDNVGGGGEPPGVNPVVCLSDGDLCKQSSPRSESLIAYGALCHCIDVRLHKAVTKRFLKCSQTKLCEGFCEPLCERFVASHHFL